MTETISPETDPKRARDSEATRAALVSAARELFEEKGYSGATVRAIGERAGADPALIARYFENKEGLYIATLAEESDGNPPRFAGLSPEAVVRLLFDRWDHPGPSPIARAMSSATIDPKVLEQVSQAVRRRLTEPIGDGLGLPDPERSTLESEMLIAMVLGVSLTRSNRTLPAIADADADEIREILARFAGSAKP